MKEKIIQVATSKTQDIFLTNKGRMFAWEVNINEDWTEKTCRWVEIQLPDFEQKNNK